MRSSSCHRRFTRGVRYRWLPLAVVVLMVFTTASAASQSTGPVIEAVPDTVPFRGETVVRGRGFIAGLEVRIHVDTPSSNPLAQAIVTSRGEVEVRIELADTAIGTHQLIACAADRNGPCAQRAATQLVIREPVAPSTTRPSTAPTSAPTEPPPATPAPSPGVAIATTSTTPTPPSTPVAPTLPGAPDGFSATSTTDLDPPFDPNPDGLSVTTSTQGPSYLPAAPLAGASLAITAVEVTQGTQNLANEMPMVAGRRTVARVYVATDGDQALVRARAGLFRDGALVDSRDAENQPVLATAEGSDRLDIDSTLLFTLPSSWTTAGPATLSFFVYEVSAQHTLDNDVDPADNFFDVGVHFFNADPLRIVLAPVHLHTNYNPNNTDVTWDPAENFAATVEIVNGIRRYLPVANIDAVIWPAEVLPLSHDFGNEFILDEQNEAGTGLASAPHERIVQMRDDSTYYENYRWYGTLPPSGLTYSLWSESAGKTISWGGLASSGVSIGAMSTATQAATPWRLRGSYLIGHELGHNYGLEHVDCKGTEAAGGAIDPDFPTGAPDCSMAPVDPEGWYGFDVYGPTIPSSGSYEVIDNDPAQSAPNAGWPLMGYEKPEWLDPYAYCGLLPQFLVPCLAYPEFQFAAAPGSNQSESVGAGQSTSVDGHGHSGATAGSDEEIEIHSIAFSVVADPAAGTGAIRLVMDKPDEPGPATFDAEGDIVVEVLDETGSVIGATALDGQDLLPHEVLEQGLSSTAGFSDRIGLAGAPAAVRLLVGGVEIDRREASPEPPVVTLEPIESGSLAGGQVVAWTTSDADGDAVTVDVRFSPDDGEHWVSLGTGLTSASARIAPGLLPATANGVLEVRAHDGFRTTVTQIRGLGVADQPPSAPLILAPTDGTRLRPYQGFTVEAQANDATDRTVLEFSVVSDLVGALGSTTTGQVDVVALPEGHHVLTVVATDSRGNTSESTVEVDVVGDAIVGDPAVDQVLQARADGALDLERVAVDRGGRPSIAMLTLAVAIGAAATAGATFAVSRSRRVDGRSHDAGP